MLWKTKESQDLWSHPENKGEEEPVFQRKGVMWEGLCLFITVSLAKICEFQVMLAVSQWQGILG